MEVQTQVVPLDIGFMKELPPPQLRAMYMSATERAMHIYLPEVCRRCGKTVWADQLVATEVEDFGSDDTVRLLLNCLNGAQTPGVFETMLRAHGMCVVLRNFLNQETEYAQTLMIQNIVQVAAFAGHAEYMRSGDPEIAHTHVTRELETQRSDAEALMASVRLAQAGQN